uniref:Peptidase A1 domain-containing protein n=1 Tax=Guillardia theta TaxID=55529 RepID=A0A7S4PC52_GUITH|mmetsp:Transcript_47921/g.150317  ORF Transcript_47921/g.150317 Transcript_47921/m.150317 type:complete len:242 (+) Transcript_47921:57-782(+)
MYSLDDISFSSILGLTCLALVHSSLPSPSSHLISSHLISSHLISSHLIFCTLISSYLRHYPESVVIGMGKRSSQYKFAKSHPTISKIPAYKRKPVNISSETAPPRYRVPMATDRIPVHNEQMTQYYINLTVGTPGQHFTAIFDTGSSVFGIFTRCIPSAPVIGRCTFGGGATGNSGVLVESAIIILSLVVLFSVVGIFVNIWCRRRQAREEQLARAKARAVNPSNSSYGPERVVSYYGTSP